MSEITRLLSPNDGGPPDIDAVFEALYPRLRQLARSNLARLNPGETLTPTALVAEAYTKLAQVDSLSLQSQQHFYACAARAMRYIIVDSVRSRYASKRSGGYELITLHEDHLALAETPQQLLDLDRALDELDALAPRQRQLVEMKFFAGLSVRDIAKIMAVSERTMWREWERAKAFLHLRLSG